MTTNVVDGWERTTVDGRAQYRQVTQAAIMPAPVKPVNGSDLLAAWRQMADAHERAIPRQQTIDAGDYGRGNGLSSASELAERRKTSRMYLVSYVLMTAGTIGGLVALAAITGVIGDSAQAFAFWLAGTGIISLGLAAWQHRRELSLTPESLEAERIAGDYDIASTDAESRRILAQAHADSLRLQAQAQLEDAQARRLAAQTATQAAMAAATRQIAQHEEPQSERRALASYRPATSATIARSELPTWQPERKPFEDSARRKLLDWLLEVYADGNAFDGDGYLRKGQVCPLSARSTLTPAERAQVADMLAQLPTWLLHYDEGRKMWQLNAKRYTNSAQAIEAIGATVTRA